MVITGCCDHPGIIQLHIAEMPHANNAIHTSTNNAANIRQYCLSQWTQFLFTVQTTGSVQYQLQTTLRFIQLHHVVPGAQMAANNRVQLIPAQFRFIPVLVDIVLTHDVSLRSHAGLAGQ